MKRLTTIVLVTLVCVACGGDDPTAPAVGTDNPSGSLSFDYSGAGGGSFSATGAPIAVASAAALLATTYAAAVKSGTGATAGIMVVANLARGGGVSDQVILNIPRQTAGTASLASSNCAAGNLICAGMTFLTGVANGGMTFGFLCSVATGSVNVTSITATRVQGTFTGSGTCLTPALASSTFTVSNATFNVALADVPAVASR